MLTTIQPGYYVTVRNAGRVGFLAGPYPSKRAAERKVDAAKKRANAADPWSWFYAFGVSRVKAPVPLRRGGVSFGFL